MKRKFLIILLLLVVVFISVPQASATLSDMVSYPLSEDEERTIIRNMDLQVVYDDSYKPGLQCFDVDQEGNYVLGFGSGDNSRAYVYNKEGQFLYGFSFDATGHHGIELYEDGLGIFCYRPYDLLIYDSTGKCIETRKIITSGNQTHQQINNYLFKTSETVDGRQYTMQRNVNVGLKYSSFSVTDADGVETVLYHEPTAKFSDILFIILGLLLVIGFGFLPIRIFEHKNDSQ